MTKEEAIRLFLFTEVPNIEEIFTQRNKNGSPFSLDRFIEVLSMKDYKIHVELNVSSTVTRRLSERLFPDKPRNNTKLCNYLLNKYYYKYCQLCDGVYNFSDFHIDNSKAFGVSSYCKSCEIERLKDNKRIYYENNKDKFRSYVAKRKAAKLQAIPKWADLEKIKEIYKKCPEGYHVDHYYPLQGKTVCGLHVEYNLQYLSAKDNLSKGNKMPEITS